MRKLILAATLLAAAAPLAAQPARHAPPVPPPGAVRALGDRVAGTADALMDVDVGPVIDAIDPRGPRGPRTLGDIATHGDPYARGRIHRDIDVASARLDATARELAIMAPRLMQTIQETRQRLKAAFRAPIEPRGRYDAPPPPPDDEDYPFEDE